MARQYNANRAPVGRVEIVGFSPEVSEDDGSKSALFVHVTEEASIHYAKGEATGVTTERKFGNNPDVGTTFETIWTGGGRYQYPTAGQTVTISSGSVTDTAGSSGASLVRVFGLRTSAWTEFSTTITMSGQTAATAATDVWRINRMIVIATSGATVTNAGVGNNGIIYCGYGTVTTGVPANVLSRIEVGENQTEQAVYSVPGGKTFFINECYASVGAGKTATLELRVRSDGRKSWTPFQDKFGSLLYQGILERDFDVPVIAQPYSDVELEGKFAQAGGAIYGGFQGILFSGVSFPATGGGG